MKDWVTTAPISKLETHFLLEGEGNREWVSTEVYSEYQFKLSELVVAGKLVVHPIKFIAILGFFFFLALRGPCQV